MKAFELGKIYQNHQNQVIQQQYANMFQGNMFGVYGQHVYPQQSMRPAPMLNGNCKFFYYLIKVIVQNNYFYCLV